MTTDPAELRQRQEEADQGHKVGLLDPKQVAWEFFDYQLEIDPSQASNSDIVEGEESKLVRFALKNGMVVEMYVYQPVRTDTTGIWAVQKYRILGR